MNERICKVCELPIISILNHSDCVKESYENIFNNMQNTPKENEYQCSACKNIYEKGWTDEESIAENEALHGDKSISSGTPQEVVCDDCFNKMREQGLF